MSDYYDDEEYMPYEEPRDFDNYNEEVFASREQAMEAWDWLLDHWHATGEAGYGPNEIYDRLTSWEPYYDEDGDLENVQYEWEYEG